MSHAQQVREAEARAEMAAEEQDRREDAVNEAILEFDAYLAAVQARIVALRSNIGVSTQPGFGGKKAQKLSAVAMDGLVHSDFIRDVAADEWGVREHDAREDLVEQIAALSQDAIR